MATYRRAAIRKSTARRTMNAEMTIPIRKSRRSTNWTMLRYACAARRSWTPRTSRAAEAEDAHQRRRDDRDQGQVAEQAAADEVVANEQQRDGEAEDARRGHRPQSEDQRVPEGTAVEPVGGEVDEVADREPPGVVRECVVEDPGERVDEEDTQEDPDRGDAKRRPPRTARAGARARL